MKKGRFYRVNEKGELNLPSYLKVNDILEYTGTKEKGVLSDSWYYRMKKKNGGNFWIRENEVDVVNTSIKKLG